MSYLYRIVVEMANQVEWAATVPALPACVGRGGTLAEALHNAHEAVERHLEKLSDNNESPPLECLPEQREFVIKVDPLLKPPGLRSAATWSVGSSRGRGVSTRSVGSNNG